MVLCKYLTEKMIKTTVKIHDQLVTWSSHHTVNSSHDFRV